MAFEWVWFMCLQGNGDVAIAEEDGWSVFTKDGNMSSQFEHEVLITENGAEILTVPS